MGVLDRGGDHQRERGSFWMNFGHPILSSGTSLHSCVEVHELIELSFGVVSGVDGGMDALDGVHVPQGEEGQFWGFVIHIGFSGVFV